jgi:hypothetical protein
MRRLALSIDWRDEDSTIPAEEVSSFMLGRVVRAEYFSGGDVLELVYEDGRTVRVILRQCRAHLCDETHLLLEEEDSVD